MGDLVVRDVSIDLNGVRIVEGVSFSLKRGMFLSLLGPNGAGKTTLMRAIAGLIPYHGSIRIDGVEVSSISDARRGKMFSYVPQMQDVHWPMRVRDVVGLGRLAFQSAFSSETDEDRVAIDEAIRATDLDRFSERQFDKLSGGEKARVMIARALSSQAGLMLADEPIAALDPYHQLHVLDVLKTHVGKGLGLITILHDIMLASQFSNSVLLMDGGRVESYGTPEEALSAENLQQVYGVRASQDFVMKKGVWERTIVSSRFDIP